MPPKMNKIACILVCDIHIIHLIKIEIIQSDFKIFVKPVLEIAVAQKTKTRYQTFALSSAQYSHAHILSIFIPIILNHLNILETDIFGALLVASGPLNSYINFYSDWTKNWLSY